MEKRGKSFDSLMRHIRNSHNIEIRGSEDKKRLVNIGYYHGTVPCQVYTLNNKN